MKLLLDIIRSVRNIRAEVNTPMSKKVPFIFQRKMIETVSSIRSKSKYIERFCNPETLTIGKELKHQANRCQLSLQEQNYSYH